MFFYSWQIILLILQLCYTGDEPPNDYFNFVLYTYIQY
jgi:hypothetical protein